MNLPRDIHIQEPRPKNSCSPEAISTRRARTATNAKKEEQ